MKEVQWMITLTAPYEDYLQYNNGLVYVSGEMYDSLSKDIESGILDILSRGNNNITISISSEGGSVFSGLALMRVIKKHQNAGVKFTGLVEGYALSMAFLILQCCDIRIMGKYDILMCHGASGISIGDKRNLDAEKKLIDKFQVDFAEIISKRNTSNDEIHHTPEFWANILDESTPQYYDSKESLSMGLIDKVED
jgi:ATP-dependent protease ClpP protease subunit